MFDIEFKEGFGLKVKEARGDVDVRGVEITPESIRISYNTDHPMVEAKKGYDRDPEFATAVQGVVSMPEEAFQHALEDIDTMREGVDKAVAEACKAWAWWAQWSRVYETAKALRDLKPAKNTGNQWVIMRKDHRIRANISNEVFELVFFIEFPISVNVKRDKDILDTMPCTAEYWLNANYTIPGSTDGKYDLLKRAERKCKSLTEAKEYLEGRAKALSKFYSEMRPPIPAEYAHFFQYNEVPLPGYTYEPAE